MAKKQSSKKAAVKSLIEASDGDNDKSYSPQEIDAMKESKRLREFAELDKICNSYSVGDRVWKFALVPDGSSVGTLKKKVMKGSISQITKSMGGMPGILVLWDSDISIKVPVPEVPTLISKEAEW